MSEIQSAAEKVELRIHNPDSSPTLVHLPGVHGDWTLIGGFRRALGENVRFVEVTYPRTVTWSLDQYAGGIVSALAARAITNTWLLAESFGSQIAWRLLHQPRFTVDGLILAGGFARHPAPWMADLAALLTGRASLKLLKVLLTAYGQIARFRFRHSPETLANVHEFIARRTELDFRAAKHRLELVAGNDPRELVRQIRLPVCALAGLFDPIVPWFPAQRWLRRNCPGIAGCRVIWRADHNVLGTAPKLAAAQVLEWMQPLLG
jgi:pimeloyl-ACP methyl ester carboxylesterase